jgi:hypothetical protein
MDGNGRVYKTKQECANCAACEIKSLSQDNTCNNSNFSALRPTGQKAEITSPVGLVCYFEGLALKGGSYGNRISGIS